MPKPGDYGVCKTNGLMGLVIRIFLNSPVNHAFIVIDDVWAIEARPSGAGYVQYAKYQNIIFNTEIDNPTDTQRQKIVYEAKLSRGTAYGFADILALALIRFGFRPKWLKNLVTASNTEICSQLVDDCYTRAGYHLFNDERLPQDVTPKDLWKRL